MHLHKKNLATHTVLLVNPIKSRGGLTHRPKALPWGSYVPRQGPGRSQARGYRSAAPTPHYHVRHMLGYIIPSGLCPSTTKYPFSSHRRRVADGILFGVATDARIRQVEDLGYVVKVFRVNDTEMHAVLLWDPDVFHVAR